MWILTPVVVQGGTVMASGLHALTQSTGTDHAADDLSYLLHHLGVHFFLKSHPGNYELAKRALGHSSINTIMRAAWPSARSTEERSTSVVTVSAVSDVPYIEMCPR
jgi:hypothetical protein